MRALTVVLPIFLLSGCIKGMPKIPKDMAPKASFNEFKIKSADFEKAETVFVFDVANPYPLGLKLTELNWKMGLAGNPLFDGANNKGIDIAKGETSKVRIPVAVKWADVFSVVTDAKGKDELPWTLDGDFAFDTPLGPLSLPFSEAGVMPALHAPRVKIEGLRLGKFSLKDQTAQLFVDVGIETDQEKPLTFKKFGYGVSLGGDVVANGATSMAPIENGKGTMTIPLSLQLVNLGSAVVTAITNKDEIRVGLDADAEVDTPLGVVPLKVSKSRKLKLQ